MKKDIATRFNNRQYMLADQFELYYYEDIHLDHVTAHQHDYFELYFFLEGSVSYEVNHRLYPLQHGNFLLIPPGLPHRPKITASNAPYRRFVLWISSSLMDDLFRSSQEFKLCFTYAFKKEHYCFHTDSVTFQDIQSKLIQLMEEGRIKRYCHEIQSILLLKSFLVGINRIVYGQTLQLEDPCLENELYLNLCNYINSHLQSDLCLDNLATIFFINKYHISHIFKENMGISLHQYIIKKRLQACKNSILSGVPINKVYQQYGFHDYTCFYRAFKKEYALSPSEFLKLHQIN